MTTIPSSGGRHERYCPSCEKSFADLEHCPDDGTRLVILDPAKDRLIGATLDGRYTVIERLGSGGMGSVYRATQHSMGREVAIKVVSPRLVTDPVIIKRFLREAKLASRLVHPNAVAILDFGQEPSTGLFYLVMELLTGQTLEDAMHGGKFMPSRTIHIATQICDALDGAHQMQIIHRDLKPANVFLVLGAGGRDLVKVLDFGLAKSLSTSGDERVSGQMTQSGALLGTPQYMPPELAMNRDVDARADLYSLGCILYHMLAGDPPFTGNSIHEVIARHAADRPEPLRDVPPPLAGIVMKLLEKAPDARFPSAAATQKALVDLVRVTGRWGMTVDEDTTLLEQHDTLPLDGPGAFTMPNRAAAGPVAVAAAPSTAGPPPPRRATTPPPPLAPPPPAPTTLDPDMAPTKALVIESSRPPWRVIGAGIAVLVLALIGFIVAAFVGSDDKPTPREDPPTTAPSVTPIAEIPDAPARSPVAPTRPAVAPVDAKPTPRATIPDARPKIRTGAPPRQPPRPPPRPPPPTRKRVDAPPATPF